MTNEFKTKIQNKSAVIGVVGLGYVGLPLSLRYAEAGYKVIGLDIDPEKPRVQLQLARVDFLEQQRLDRRSRGYIEQMIRNALKTQPLKVYQLAADLEQLARICAMPEAEVLASRCDAAGLGPGSIQGE